MEPEHGSSSLPRALTAWVRSAKKTESFGALPAELKEFVSSRGLTALRAVLPADVQDRVACIKRREQNQRALEARRAARNQRVEEMRAELETMRLRCLWMKTHAEVMAEYDEHLAQHDGSELFRQGAQAHYLYGAIHAKSNSKPAFSGATAGAAIEGCRGKEGDALFDCDLSFLGGPFSVEAMDAVSGAGDAIGISAADKL